MTDPYDEWRKRLADIVPGGARAARLTHADKDALMDAIERGASTEEINTMLLGLIERSEAYRRSTPDRKPE
jgi:hypothetical protein